jgi:hypothetical protein
MRVPSAIVASTTSYDHPAAVSSAALTHGKELVTHGNIKRGIPPAIVIGRTNLGP